MVVREGLSLVAFVCGGAFCLASCPVSVFSLCLMSSLTGDDRGGTVLTLEL